MDEKEIFKEKYRKNSLKIDERIAWAVWYYAKSCIRKSYVVTDIFD